MVAGKGGKRGGSLGEACWLIETLIACNFTMDTIPQRQVSPDAVVTSAAYILFYRARDASPSDEESTLAETEDAGLESTVAPPDVLQSLVALESLD